MQPKENQSINASTIVLSLFLAADGVFRPLFLSFRTIWSALDTKNIAGCILVLCQVKKTLSLPEADALLYQMAEWLEESSQEDDRLSYLAKAYLLILACSATANKQLMTKTIKKAINYAENNTDTGSGLLADIYFLHRMHLETGEETLKKNALDKLHSFIGQRSGTG